MSSAAPQYDGPKALAEALSALSLVQFAEDGFTRDGPRADVEYLSLIHI